MESIFSLFKKLFGDNFLSSLINYLVRREDFQEFALQLILKPAKKLETTEPELYALIKSYVEKVVKIPSVFTDDNQANTAQITQLFQLEQHVEEAAKSGKAIVVRTQAKSKALKLSV